MNNPFTKREIKAKVEYRYVGELRKVGIRQAGIWEVGKDIAVSDTYYVVLIDREGMTQSLYRKNSSYERAEAIAAKIPTGKTLVIEGSVKARGTNVYFEAKTVCYPNGDNVLVWAAEGEGEEKENVA